MNGFGKQPDLRGNSLSIKDKMILDRNGKLTTKNAKIENLQVKNLTVNGNSTGSSNYQAYTSIPLYSTLYGYSQTLLKDNEICYGNAPIKSAIDFYGTPNKPYNIQFNLYTTFEGTQPINTVNPANFQINQVVNCVGNSLYSTTNYILANNNDFVAVNITPTVSPCTIVFTDPTPGPTYAANTITTAVSSIYMAEL